MDCTDSVAANNVDNYSQSYSDALKCDSVDKSNGTV